MVMYYTRDILVVQVVLHHRSISTLGELPSFLNSALVKDACHGEFAVVLVLVCFFENFLTWHHKSLDG